MFDYSKAYLLDILEILYDEKIRAMKFAPPGFIVVSSLNKIYLLLSICVLDKKNIDDDHDDYLV